jgi:sugar lactone lactonase YvrE
MQHFETEVLYLPTDEKLRFLSEGPQATADGHISWVAIQHGPQATTGSLNLLDLEGLRSQDGPMDPSGPSNRCYPLAGRPGFAIPTRQPGTFVVGMERQVVVLDVDTGRQETLCQDVDHDVAGTIINDGLAFEQGLVFGTKDLRFEQAKAGLYLWRRSDRRLIRLRDDQICSNGKVLIQQDGQTCLLDIDSPARTVVSYPLDVSEGRLGPPRVVVDLREDGAFPDGMVVCPDGRSVIVALYDPRDVDHGQARQYSIATGQVEAVWTSPGSAQVTCPLLVEWEGRVRLVLTTAVEHMTADRKLRNPQAGAIFWGETPFDQLGAATPFVWSL